MHEGMMPEISVILLHLFIMFAAAKLAGEVFIRLRQPAVIGELLAGILIGPSVLGLIGHPNAALVHVLGGNVAMATKALDLVYHTLSELGVVVLLFYVGLETRASDLMRVGGRALSVGVVGVIVPFILGAGYMLWLGEPLPRALFVGAALVATSVGITARVLRDLGESRSRPARIIVGAAVIDDILAILVLSVVIGLAAGGPPSWLSLGASAAVAVGFTTFTIFIGARLARRLSLHLERLRLENAPFAVAMLLMLGLAALAGFLGLAAIIGAFLAGMVLAETREHERIEDQTQPVYDFLVPFFFVVTGSAVDVAVFARLEILGLIALVTVLALAGKIVGCGVAALPEGWLRALIVGVGMAPRGEVGLIVASIGLSQGVLGHDLFSVIVAMSILTTLVVPPVLMVLLRRDRRATRVATMPAIAGEP
jgi:Kef-type K+ transport system membrane component KefB